MMLLNNTVARIKLILCMLPLMVTGCGGGGSSSSGNQTPNASAGPDISARFGSEVVLSGRDSYDNDGPIMVYTWEQISGTEVVLADVTSSAVKFTVPNGSEDEELIFQLTVEDNRGKTASDRVTVTATGPVDSDRFLTYLNAPSDFVVEIALADSEPGLTTDVDFQLTFQVEQRYRNLEGDYESRFFASEARSGTWTAQQQTNDTYPQFNFDIPAARIEDLVDVNKGARDDIQLILNFTVSDITASVDYEIRVLDQNGESIDAISLTASSLLAKRGSTKSSSILSDLDFRLVDLLDNLGNSLVESQTTANAYYAAIDPDNEKTTLNDWLAANNYDENTAKRAQYLNGFDLAFGRDMQVWTNDSNHVFAVVENYPNVDSMVNGTNHVATVAMEYSPGPSGGDPYTKYYTFVLDPLTGEQRRVGSMDFDGRGEKYTPGNCVVCHGGTPAALVDGVYPNEGNIDGGFMLWDVETFAFSDAEYEGRYPTEEENVLSKSKQQDEFKYFNETLLLTNLTDAQREIIYGWYGGETLPNNTLNELFIPTAWRSPSEGGPETNPETASDFYLDVFAPTCRACHNALDDEDLRFATYQNFMAAQDDIIHRVFNEGSMPLARVTMDNFWVGTQSEVDESGATRAALLAEHLGVDIETQKPGLPSAVITAQSVNDDTTNTLPGSTEQSSAIVLRGDRINLSALSSLYADTYTWSLTLPENSSASLSSSDASTASFVTDIYGDFVVSLSIENDSDVADDARFTYRVENNFPAAGDFEASTKEDESVEINVLASPTTFGDGELADHAVVSISNQAGGSAIIGSGGVITFTPSGAGAAGFDYQIEDIDGDESVEVGSVAVTVTALPSASNDSENASVGTQSFTRAISIPEVNILGNDTLGVEPTSVVSVTRTGGSLSNGLNGCGSASGVLSYDGINNEFDYTPPVACAGTETYQYTIRDDNGDESTATITMTISRTSAGAFSNVTTAIANTGCAGSFCHDDSHVMDLIGSNSAIWTDIVECNAGGSPDTGSDCLLGARIDLTTPASSLLLQKPLGVGHGGGTIFGSTSDADYLRLLRWIEEGAVAP